MKFAGLTVILGFAAFVGWTEAGIVHQRNVLQAIENSSGLPGVSQKCNANYYEFGTSDFVDKSDLQLGQLKKLAQVTDPELQKEIREHVGRKLKRFEAILQAEGDVQPRTGVLGHARKVLKDYLVSTEIQYKQLRQLLKTADPALQEEIRVTVEKKIGHFRALLDAEGRKADPGQAIAKPSQQF